MRSAARHLFADTLAEPVRFVSMAYRLRSLALRVLVSAVALLGAAAAVAADPVPSEHDAFIGGYSPVSYFTEGKAEKGSVDFAVAHDGRVYYLTSQEQVQLFNENPARYRPRYDVCPFSLTTGKRRALDPTNFKVIGDTLLLFHKSPGIDGLEGWHTSPLTDQELLDRADNQFVLLRF